METKFEFCVLQYLEIWYLHDKNGYEKLSVADLSDEARLKALKKALTFYKVARTLPNPNEKQGDNNNIRYLKILELLDENQANINEDNYHDEVERVKKEISKFYWGDSNRNTLSVSSKTLWLKYRSPIKIYDSRARNALQKWIRKEEPGKKNLTNYNEFTSVWNQFYDKHKNEIKEACEKLDEYLKYGRIYNLVKNEKVIFSIVKEDWFKERVFDIYLWNLGEKD